MNPGSFRDMPTVQTKRHTARPTPHCPPLERVGSSQPSRHLPRCEHVITPSKSKNNERLLSLRPNFGGERDKLPLQQTCNLAGSSIQSPRVRCTALQRRPSRSRQVASSQCSRRTPYARFGTTSSSSHRRVGAAYNWTG